jgi:hypothetical protein
VGVEGLRAVDDDVFELRVELFENSFGEAGSDVADGFVGIGCGIVAG